MKGLNPFPKELIDIGFDIYYDLTHDSVTFKKNGKSMILSMHELSRNCHDEKSLGNYILEKFNNHE